MSDIEQDDEDASWLVLEHCSDCGSVNVPASNSESEAESSSGDDVGADLPHCISSMLCGDNMPYKRLVETLTELRGEAHLKLPSIVVCGAQSHGKSSTLERIAQREVFPRDSKICTRMVVRLMLRRSNEKETKVRVFDTKESTGIRPSWTGVAEGSSLPDAIKAIMNDSVDKTHEGQLRAIDGRHELQVVLQAPNVPTIDLVDLPGVVNTVNGAVSDALTKRFLAREHTLVLVIASAADTSVEVNPIWPLVRDNKNPAVAALTFMDWTRHDAEDLVAILNKDPEFVPAGDSVQSVIPIINRSTRERGNQVSLPGALAAETRALTAKLEEIGMSFDASQHGIRAVVGALGSMLHDYMANTWVRAELVKLVCNLAPVVKELGELGVRPEVVTRAEIDDAIKTVWAHLVSRDLSKWNAAAHGDTLAGDETQSDVLFGLRIERAGDLEQQFLAELDERMDAALRSVQRMLEESIQTTCAEPPVKLVRFSAIIELCKAALEDVFEMDRAQIRGEVEDTARRMIKDTKLSLDSDQVDVATLTNNVRALVFTDVAYSLLRRGAFFAAFEARLGPGVCPELLEETDAARRQELEYKVELVGKAAKELLALMSTTGSDAEEVAADIDNVMSASKSGRVGDKQVDVLGLRMQSELLCAANEGREGVAKLLLDSAADVHAKTDSGSTALHLACWNGHEGVAKLLLDSDADVHAKLDNGCTALGLACVNGHEGVAKLLLDNGADMHAKSGDNGYTALLLACVNGHGGVAKLLLDNGADVHAKDNHDNTALDSACLNGQEGVVKVLLDNGADVHAKSDDNGYTALHLACGQGHEGVVKVLLDNGAHMHAKDNNGNTAQDLACVNGQEGVVKLLLDNGADVHAKRNDGWLVLHLACLNGHEGVAKLLLDNGADMHAKSDDNGYTALHLACGQGHEGVTKLLLDNGADMHAKDNNGNTALDLACLNGHEGVAKLLLENGADMHATNKAGYTALHIACGRGQEGVAKLLLDNGADVHAKHNDGTTELYLALGAFAELMLEVGANLHAEAKCGETALHSTCREGHEGVAKLLLDKGADVHAKKDDGWLALHSACYNGHEGVAKLLLDNSADVHAKDNTGWLALHSACYNGHEGVAKLLLGSGADVHATNNTGWLALHLACQNGHEGVAKLLLDFGANVHAKTNMGNTALYWTCKNGHEDIAKLLLENGADVHAKDNDGETALHVACQRGHEGVAKLLRSCGAS